MPAAPLLVSFACVLALPPAPAALSAAQGAMADEGNASSRFRQTRLTSIPGMALDANGDVPRSAGVACFEYNQESDLSPAKRSAWMDAVAPQGFIVRAALVPGFIIVSGDRHWQYPGIHSSGYGNLPTHDLSSNPATISAK